MKIDIKNNGYRCKYCNGYVNPATMKCEYCDTQYEHNESLNYFVVKKGVQTICSKMAVSRELQRYQNKKEYENLITETLAKGFLPFIKDNMKIEEVYDPRSMITQYYAKIDFAIGDNYEHI